MDARLTQGEREVNERPGPVFTPTGGLVPPESSPIDDSDGSDGDGTVNARVRDLHCSHERGGDRRRDRRGAHRRRGGGTLDDPPRVRRVRGRAPEGRGGVRGAHPGVGPGARGPRSDPRNHARRGPVVGSGLTDRLRQRRPRTSSRRASRDARPGLPTEHRRDHPPGGGTRAAWRSRTSKRERPPAGSA